jgi:signal transduction histidine kinase
VPFDERGATDDELDLPPEELRARMRYLRVMERIHGLIVRATSLETMLDDLLGELLDLLGCDRAWLLEPCDPDAASWRVPMERSRPEWPGAFAAGVDIPMTPDAADVFARVLREAGPHRFDSASGLAVPASAARFSVRAQMLVGIFPKVGHPWLLGVHHCREAHVFTPEEVRLFDGIGRRLGDGLATLLTLRDLRRSQDSLAEAQRVGRVGGFSIDLATGRVECSGEVYRIFGADPGTFAPTYDAFLARIHPDDRVAAERSLRDALEAHTRCDVVYRLPLADGTVAYAHARAEGVYDAGGRALRAVGTVQDVTEREVAARALADYRDRLEELVAARTAELARANQELEAFTSSASHDLRAPLRAIDGFSQVLLEDAGDGLSDAARAHLARIRGGCKRMQAIIDGLLQLARASQRELRVARVDVSALAGEIVERLRERDGGRAVDVRIEPGLTVDADPELLAIALENLLENAWKFTRDAAPARIEVGRAAGGFLFVRDNGAGFDPALGGRLFEAFQRLHGAEYPGTGIGLATVSRIVRRHGGELRAEGASGAGATFAFRIG